ncbi:hypothetical protein GYMLUDRAFT_34213 [Collybiopsis luxurians FD-317 M1]|nr:hypothetical protein GYMLUDRAFT_34213 [Collybiopsis luxurians FD-317 M1]
MSSPDPPLIPFPDDGDSDNEMDWEEVQVPDQPSHDQPLMKIVLRPDNEDEVLAKKKSNVMSHAERLLRIDCHKIHTVLLLLSARIRNKWLNDELLHARLLSLTPLQLQNAFALIHSSRVPEAPRRGRMFETAVVRLVEWWSESFFEVTEESHIRNNTFDWINQRLQTFVPGFGEVFEAAVTAKEETDKFRKPSTKGKQKERTPLSADPLIDSNDLDLLEDILDNSLEPIKSPKSLMKHALMQSGSRDTSAQLFTALCRALGIPARLVASLQSVPWKASVGRDPKKSKTSVGKGKGKEKEKEEEEPADLIPTIFPSSSTSKGAFSDAGEGQRLDGAPVPKREMAKPAVKLRKSKAKGNVLGGAGTGSSSSKPKKVVRDDPRTTPPIYWTEVFSKADSRWIPVDPIRGYVNKRHVFDPSPSTSNPSSSASSGGDNRLLYVLGFEEDGYARDVTRRYAREFGAKIAKVQGGSGNAGRARMHWWEGVVALVTRPFRLNRDDIEDSEFETAQLMEGMPTSISGFKDHPLYVLPRHLKQHESIHPPPAPPEASSRSSTPYFGFGRASATSYTPELGKFRGEPVYPRSSVISLKTPENWLRSEGRQVKEGEVPIKYVKLRASTIGKRREVEMIKEGMKEFNARTNAKGKGKGTDEEVMGEKDGVLDIHVDELDGGDVEGSGTRGGADIMQGLYARHQTEPYVSDPVVNGIIPKNQFGNIDLYVRSMLPKGAVHMPFKGITKIARKLQIDFAEAVTGFEFRKRRATPVVEGIVIAAEYEEIVLEAFLEAERETFEKARLKKEERVLKQWTRLVHGLRIRQRLQEQYANRGGDTERDTTAAASTTKRDADDATTARKKGAKSSGKIDATQGMDERRDKEGPDGSTGIKTSHNDENEAHEEFEDIPSGTGFLVGAGDVVQPFRLPKLPQLDKDLVGYSDIQSRARFSRSGVDVTIDDGNADGGVPLPDFKTYDIDGDMNSAAMDVQADGDRTSQFPVLPTPKTMQELAEADDATRARSESHDPDFADRVQAQAPNQSLEIASTKSASRSTKTKRDESVINPASANGVITTRTTRSVGTKSRGSKVTLTARRRSTRKRHRSDDDSDDAPDVDEDAEPSSSPSKRSRRGGSSLKASTSTRVLRPRTAKTKAQLDQEQDNEEAYRRATAE